MNETLNEQGAKTAKKEAGGFCFPIFKAEVKDIGGAKADRRTIYIEAERWVDARGFACRKLGVPEAIVQGRGEDESRPIPRWQVRYEGTSGHPTNGMRMQARLIQNETDDVEHGWLDVRDL